MCAMLVPNPSALHNAWLNLIPIDRVAVNGNDPVMLPPIKGGCVGNVSQRLSQLINAVGLHDNLRGLWSVPNIVEVVSLLNNKLHD